MSLTDLLGTIIISEQIRGGMEPGVTMTFRVDAAGFHDAGGLGRSGKKIDTLNVAEVASILMSNLPADKLRVLLGHFVRLHEELSR
jgi:hypothetical protein